MKFSSYLTNLDLAIIVLTRVENNKYNFHMGFWQRSHNGLLKTEVNAHQCGMTACAGGWLAVSPECIERGLMARKSGEPFYKGYFGYSALALFLDIPDLEARFIFSTSTIENYSYMP